MLAVSIFMNILEGGLLCLLILQFLGFVSTKELGGGYIVFFGLDFVWDNLQGKPMVSLFIDALLFGIGLFLYKFGNDDDDYRKRRKRLLSKIGKKLPKPTLVKIRPIGVPT